MTMKRRTKGWGSGLIAAVLIMGVAVGVAVAREEKLPQLVTDSGSLCLPTQAALGLVKSTAPEVEIKAYGNTEASVIAERLSKELQDYKLYWDRRHDGTGNMFVFSRPGSNLVMVVNEYERKLCSSAVVLVPRDKVDAAADDGWRDMPKLERLD